MHQSARQHPPHTAHSPFMAIAAARRARSVSVIGMRGTAGPKQSLNFPIPFSEQREGLRKHFRPEMDAKYSIITPPNIGKRLIGIRCANNRIRNGDLIISPANIKIR